MSPLLDQSKNLLLDDKEKATPLNYVLVYQNTSLALEAFSFGPSPLQETFEIDSISPKEVAETLRSLPNKSSCRSGEISYRFMKETGPARVGPLVTLFNRSENNIHKARVDIGSYSPRTYGPRCARLTKSTYLPIRWRGKYGRGQPCAQRAISRGEYTCTAPTSTSTRWILYLFFNSLALFSTKLK